MPLLIVERSACIKKFFLKNIFMFFLSIIGMQSYGCVRFTDKVTAIDFTSQGSKLLIGLSNGMIHCLQLSTGQCVNSFHDYSNSVTALCGLPTGHIVGYADGSLSMEVSGSKKMLIKKHKEKISSIINAGEFFLVGSYDKSVSIWGNDGSFSFQLAIGSEVTALAVDSTARTAFIGCLDGKVYCFDRTTLTLTLVDIPLVDSISCLSTGMSTLGIGSGNVVLLYNYIHNSYKLIRTSKDVCSIDTRDSNKTVTVLCENGDMYVFDEPSGVEIEHCAYIQHGASDVPWRAVICADKIGSAVDNMVCVHVVSQDPVMEISLMTDLGVDSVDNVSIVDSFGFVVGITGVKAGVHKLKMQLKPRAQNFAKENFVVLQKKDHTSALFRLKYSLSMIKKMIVTQSLADDDVYVWYLTELKNPSVCVDPCPIIQWHCAHAITSSFVIEPCMSHVLNLVLYSMNVVIKNVFLKKRDGAVVQGVNSEGKGAIWRFQDLSQRCQGSCNLTILTDAARYIWHIHHLNEQSELFLTELVPSVTSESFLKKIKQRDALFNVEDKEALAVLINSQRKNGAFLKLSHYVEHVNQSYDIPLTSVMSLPV